ncbi:hypothetical protein Tco_0792445 [Tanacetum coccineum]
MGKKRGINNVIKVTLFDVITTPFGVKGWKSLVFYDKSIKSWSWVGPLSQNLPNQYHEAVNEATSPDLWDEVDIEDDGTLSTKRWKKQKNESNINLMPDMKELRECSDGEQHMKNDVVASNMCGKGRVHPVPSLAW